jgi:hypothetical protein
MKVSRSSLDIEKSRDIFMNRLEQNIHALDQKVDGLYQIIEHLSLQMAQCQEHNPPSTPKATDSLDSMNSVSRYKQYAQSSRISQLEMAHKDILVDEEEGFRDTSYDQELSPETQIRRLTVQLMAAYNRIAALEEQVLSQRIHS